ncbi:transcription factor Adf-1-like isoform X2 [Melanotaenia boesemani]|uniref:transcription factor Adf-1-like isoform X2 n=1 Tax=Melanotaenia boesemani TaxID=1250792 RepID=UPI001C04E08F|nr:transcription factor Adf-1-like isoform X2 [Melanotaenia boesemani]
MDNEMFILEVESHTVLYDTRHPFYKDNARKDKAWAEIAEKIGVEVEVCKTKWKAFRDAFVKHRKRAQHPSGLAGGGIQREYKYAALMDFVVPFLQPRRSNPSLAPANTGDRSDPGTPQSMSGSESDERPSTPVIQPVQPLPSPTPSVSAPTTSGRTERPSRSRSPRHRPQTSRGTSRVKQETARSQSANPDIAGRLMSLLEEPVPKPQMPDEDLDECYHFALSIVPMLYKLDEDGRQEAKINILRTIHNIRKRSQQTTVPQQQT